MVRRRAGEGLPAPPLPVSPTEAQLAADNAASARRRTGLPQYPAFDISRTREENLQKTNLRRDPRKRPPYPLIRRIWEARQATQGS